MEQFAINDRIEEIQDPLVSVIVPVYNTKEYLEQCLNSIKTQTLKEIEIIVVDDGSTDGSEDICDQYAKQDSRFRVLHKKNEGLASTRNYGLTHAKAGYIMWVDSDDWVEPDFCEAAYKSAIANSADIVAFLCSIYGENVVKKWPLFPNEGITDKKLVLIDYWTLVSMVVWNKLYKKSLFDGIQYPVGHLSEDTAVTHRIINRAKKIYLLNKHLYNYRNYRPGSIMNLRSDRFTRDSFGFSFRRFVDLKSWGYDCREEAEQFALSYLAVIGRHSEYSSQCGKILHETKRFPRAASWRQRLMFRAYKLSPCLFDALSIIMRRRICKREPPEERATQLQIR